MKIRKTIKNSVSSNLKSTIVNRKENKELVNEKIQDLLGFNQNLKNSEINLKIMKNRYEERKENYNNLKELYENEEKSYYQKYQEFFSENNFFLQEDNENNFNMSNYESHKGLLNKLKDVKEIINEKIDLISTAENELDTLEHKTLEKYGKLTESEREQYDRLEKEYFMKNSDNLEEEINKFKNTLPKLNFDKLIEDITKSSSSINGKSSNKHFDYPAKDIKSFENSPKMLLDNSINYEKSIESFNKHNLLSGMTNYDNDFNEDDRFKKLKETQYNILEKSDNDLLTNNIDFLLNEIKNLEKKSNEILDKKAYTEDNLQLLKALPEIKLKVDSEFISFKQAEEKSKDNLIHLSNEKKTEQNKSVCFSLKKSTLLAREEISKKKTLDSDYNNKSFNHTKSNKSKELLSREKDYSLGNTPRTVSKNGKPGYGINISLNSIKKNIITHITGVRENSNDDKSKNRKKDVLNYSDLKFQDSPVMKTVHEKIDKMHKFSSSKNLKFEDKKRERSENKSKIDSKNNSKSKNSSSTTTLLKNEYNKSQNSFTHTHNKSAAFLSPVQTHRKTRVNKNSNLHNKLAEKKPNFI